MRERREREREREKGERGGVIDIYNGRVVKDY